MWKLKLLGFFSLFHHFYIHWKWYLTNIWNRNEANISKNIQYTWCKKQNYKKYWYFLDSLPLYVNIKSIVAIVKKNAKNLKSTILRLFKGTVMQIEKALTSDCLRVLKVSWKLRIPTIYSFPVIYAWNMLFS